MQPGAPNALSIDENGYDVPMSMWTIYHKPKGHPDVNYLARKWVIEKGNDPKPTEEIIKAATLKEARDSLPPELFCLGRYESDDPCIVETWI